MKYIQKKAASSWSSFKKKTDTGGGEKRFFLGSPSDLNIIDLQLDVNNKELKLHFDGTSLSELGKLFSQFEFYQYVKGNYCYPEAKSDIDDTIFSSIILAYQEILSTNETFDAKITNDGSRVYVVSSHLFKKISLICPPEISGLIITHVKDDLYKLNLYFDANFLNKFGLIIDFITPVPSGNRADIPKLFFENIGQSGLIFNIELVTRFIASLCTKPFVICSGLSGSGKTKLAQAFAQWISFDDSQYLIVPVGADWTNREPLLGYPNAFNKQEYVSPENGVLDIMIRAKKNFENNEEETKPYFLILDEMNLSHVERYFADFLSTMESGHQIPLHKIENEINGVPGSIRLPKNLFLIGTVNIDETTYMFSPKVLDRANTIEFRLTESDLTGFIESEIKLDLDVLKAKGVNMSDRFIKMALQETRKNLTGVEKDLSLFFTELKKSGAEFGYRTASEIGRLMYMLDGLGESGANLLDIAIMQKLLPKLHGSRNKLTKVLPVLGGFCLNDHTKIKEEYLDQFLNNNLSEDKIKADLNIKYKISFEKICRMYKNAVENGFASYAEA